MKTIVAISAVLVLAASLASQADAATKKKHKRYAGHYYSQSYQRDGWREGESFSGYFEHRLDAVPFGSAQWWKIQEFNAPRR